MELRSRHATAMMADMTVSVMLHLVAATVLAVLIAGLLWRGR